MPLPFHTRVSIEIQYNHFRPIARKLPKAATQRTHEAAVDIAHYVRRGAPRETGAGAASVYVASGYGSDYGAAVGAARAIMPDVEIVGEERPRQDGEAVIGVAAGHMVFPHNGTSLQPAQPFLKTAVESAGPLFVNRLAKIEPLLRV